MPPRKPAAMPQDLPKAAPRVVREPKPAWLKVRAPGGERYASLKQTLRKLDLYTVCEEARCPNVGECWAAGTATIMLLGHTCTRGCRFCAVTTGNPRGAYDPREPEHVARAVAELDLAYVVLTMVDRDDLIDGGALQVARTVRGLRERRPELLDRDARRRFSWAARRRRYGGRCRAPTSSRTTWRCTRRLTPTIRDARCDYDGSLAVLRHAKEGAPERFVKSSIMVGIGETDDEVLETLSDLRTSGVDIVTLGQYLRPDAEARSRGALRPTRDVRELRACRARHGLSPSSWPARSCGRATTLRKASWRRVGALPKARPRA